MAVVLLDPENRQAVAGRQRLALTPGQTQLLLVLAEAPDRRLTRWALARALGTPVGAAHSSFVGLRQRAAREDFPLDLHIDPAPRGMQAIYVLGGETQIVRRSAVSLDADSLRLVIRLIDLCSDAAVAATARRHFIG